MGERTFKDSGISWKEATHLGVIVTLRYWLGDVEKKDSPKSLWSYSADTGLRYSGYRKADFNPG